METHRDVATKHRGNLGYQKLRVKRIAMSHILQIGTLHVCHIPVMSHYARPRQTPSPPPRTAVRSPEVRQSPDWSCGRLGGLTQASAFQHHPLTQANDLLTGKNWKVNDSGEGAQEQETFLKTQVYNGLPMFPHISLVALRCSTAHASSNHVGCL